MGTRRLGQHGATRARSTRARRREKLCVSTRIHKRRLVGASERARRPQGVATRALGREQFCVNTRARRRGKFSVSTRIRIGTGIRGGIVAR
ncbi:MAG: hypothetical protein FJZ00_04305, partial [Candidatus Sericytochromatia bacterium]|nr:hypothetical protein [Candidatus Tanganyikabacteria bacterium]